MHLEYWMAETRTTAREIAAALGVSVQSVYRWTRGGACPAPDMIAKIQRLTARAVTFDDLYRSRKER